MVRRVLFADRGDTHAADRIRGIKGDYRVDVAFQWAGRQLASSTAAEIRLKVGINWGVRRGLLAFQSPLLLRTVDQAQVVDASIGLGGLASTNEVRDRDSGQQTDDRNNDHDFNEGEARFAAGFHLHSIYLSFLCGSERVRGVLLLIHSFTLLPLTNRTYGLATPVPCSILRKTIVQHYKWGSPQGKYEGW